MASGSPGNPRQAEPGGLRQPSVMLSPGARPVPPVTLSPLGWSIPSVMLSPLGLFGGEASVGRAAIVLAALLLQALPAAAQSSEAPQRKGTFHVGPFWLTPKVVLYNAGNDSNVYNDEVDPVAAGSGTLRPSLEALLPVGKKLDLKATGWLGWSWYNDQEDQGSVDRALSAEAELRLGPVTVGANAGRGWAYQRFSIEIDERLERTDESFGGDVDLALGRRLAVGASVQERRYRFEEGVQIGGDAVSTSLDRDTQSVQGHADVELTNFTTLVFEAGRQEDTFVSDVALSDPVAVSYRYAAGFDFVAGGLFTGNFRIGWRNYPADQEAAPAAEELLLDGNLATNAGQLGRLTLELGRDITYAAERVAGTRNSYVMNRYGVALDTELPASLVARGFLRWERADFILPYPVEGQPQDRRDTVDTQGLGLFRAFGSTFRVGGTIEWSERKSDVPGFDYTRRAYGLSAEWAP